MDYQNSVNRALKIYQREGLFPLIKKVKRKLSRKIVRTKIVDSMLYNKSLNELEKRKLKENGIDDILNTTGYTVVDLDAVRISELEQGDRPYAGFGQFPGKYSGHGIYSSISMEQERKSIKNLARTVNKQNPRTILEIGSNKGGSFYLWCRYIGNAELLVSLDLSIPGRRGEFFQQFSKKKNIKYIEGDSQNEQTYYLVKDSLDGRHLDFIYIDASHKYKNVKSDFERYRKLIKGDGIVGFHDISHPGTGVPEYWKDIRNDFKTEEFGSGPVKNGLVWV